MMYGSLGADGSSIQLCKVAGTRESTGTSGQAPPSLPAFHAVEEVGFLWPSARALVGVRALVHVYAVIPSLSGGGAMSRSASILPHTAASCHTYAHMLR